MFYPGGDWLIFPIIGLVFMALMLVVVLGVGRRGAAAEPPCRWGPSSHDRRDDALEILRRRFAAGELTAEEFDSMRRPPDGR